MAEESTQSEQKLRKNPELVDPLLDLDTEPTPRKAFSLSSKAFKAANNCQTQTWHLVQGSKALKPSAFAINYFRDGNAWEAKLLDAANRANWIDRFNAVFNEQLSANAEFKDLSAQQSGKKDFEQWRIHCAAGLDFIKEHFNKDPKAPLILAQVSLIPAEALDSAEAPLDRMGIADLIIWTGQAWYLGDIKLSEAATVEHGAQIQLYRDLWAGLLAHRGLPDAIAPSGFVIHAAPGFPFSTQQTEEAQEEATRLLALDAFSYENLETDFKRMLGVIEAQQAEGAPCPEPFFQKRCPECGYRGQCYGQLLGEDDLSIAFLPVPRSRSRALYESGIKTLGQFITDAESAKPSAVVDEISGNLESVRNELVRKAELAQTHGGSSNWRFPQDWRKKVVFFVKVPDQEGHWFDAEGSVLAVEAIDSDSILIAYTEAERRRAVATVLDGKRSFKLSFALQEEVQAKLHFPLPGWTLREVARWAKRMAQENNNARFMKAWDYEPTEDILSTNKARADAVLTVWNFLIQPLAASKTDAR